MEGERNMKIMRKTRVLAAMLAGMFLMGAMAGCGTSKKGADGTVTISVGAFFPDEESQPEAYAKCMETVKAFEEKYPNYKVVDPKWSFDIKNYIAMAEGGTLPTIYNVPLTECKKVIDAGYAADLTEEFKARGMFDAINEFMLKNISKDGKIYIIPYSNYDQGIMVNIDLYKQAGFVEEDGTLYQPETWEDLAKVAKKIKETTGADGFVIPTTGNVGGWRFTPIAWSYGTVFETKDENGKWKATFDSKECAAALQFVKDLKWKYDVLPANTLLDLNSTVESFAGGSVAMMLGEADRASAAISVYKMDKDNIGFLSMPAGPKRRVSLMGGAMRVISNTATPEEIKAAMDWLEFTGMTVKLTDDVKESLNNNIERQKAEGQIIGLNGLSPWKDSCETRKYQLDLNKNNANVNLKNIEHYNNKDGIEYQAEEPVDAQALYALLDTVIQEVLNNKDADVDKLLEDIASDFQNNNLDYVE